MPPKQQLNYHTYSYEDEGYTVHMLTSGEHSFLTNAYIVETKSALVVIDTMMINSDALLLRLHLDRINKPLIAVIITHGHPDHYNGTEIITEGFNEIPIISTKGVYHCIQNSVDSKEVKWKPIFGSDWPRNKVLPNRFVSDCETIYLDGLSYRFRDLGAAESSSDLFFTLGEQRSVVFVGDIVFNHTHGFMNDGNSRQWLIVLHKLLTELSDIETLFTGHGAPGHAYQLVKKQIEYIVYYRSSLLNITDESLLLNEEQRTFFENLIIDKYSEYDLTYFITAGIDSVTEELRLEKLAGTQQKPKH